MKALEFAGSGDASRLTIQRAAARSHLLKLNKAGRANMKNFTKERIAVYKDIAK